MICKDCIGQVYWVGKLTNLTHTECEDCGAINSQILEDSIEMFEEDSTPDVYEATKD